MQYTIWIVSPPNYTHSQAFNEVSLALQDGLIALGHECKIATSSFECRGRTIVLGANLLASCGHFLTDIPDDMVFYNLEQIAPGSPWITKEYIGLLRGKQLGGHRKFEVWDYSEANIEELGKLGVKAKLCEIGYSPGLERIKEGPKDIDVLHYGSMTDRRMQIINQLAEAGVRVHGAFGVYGQERDDLIARSKIVLNVHFYESKVFEIVRCSYLMANKKCIVSETGSGGGKFKDGICFSEYGGIVASCVSLLADGAGQLAKRGYEIFKEMRQADFLEPLVGRV